MTSRVLVAVSLKAYFGYAQTRDWLGRIAEMLTERPVTSSVELAVLPPFPLLECAVQTLGELGVQVGAQDVSWAEPGPVTGEVTAALLAEMGCRYTEVGHAERREHFGEDDATVVRKAVVSANHGMVPLVCVGERTKDVDAVGDVIQQAGVVIDALGEREFVIAYEPRWAIGAEAPADASHVLRVGDALRSAIPALERGRLVYGGTAGPGTITALARCFDGVFLGRRAHRLDALRQVLDEAVSAQ